MQEIIAKLRQGLQQLGDVGMQILSSIDDQLERGLELETEKKFTERNRLKSAKVIERRSPTLKEILELHLGAIESFFVVLPNCASAAETYLKHSLSVGQVQYAFDADEKSEVFLQVKGESALPTNELYPPASPELVKTFADIRTMILNLEEDERSQRPE